MQYRRILVDIYCFKKENLHCVWDDSLVGKEVVVADSVCELFMKLEEEAEPEVVVTTSVTCSPDLTYPFCDSHSTVWKFAYILEPATDDIEYDTVKNAYKQGHTIERRYADGEWESMDETSYFDLPGYEYRVKYDHVSDGTSRVTNRQLARWLAQGMGEYISELTNNICGTEFVYSVDEDEDDVGSHVSVRKWDDNKWHVPTKEYLGIEE